MLDDPDTADAAVPAIPAPGVFFRIAARLIAVDAAAAAAAAAVEADDVVLPLMVVVDEMTPPDPFLSAGLPSTSAAVIDRPPAVAVLAARLAMVSGEPLGGGGRGRERFLGRAKALLPIPAAAAVFLSGLSPVRSIVSPILL